jgi:putative ABC transport system permease protein
MNMPSRHDRVFRALLRLFPAEFRGDFGEQMAEDFRDQRYDAAANGGSRRLWIRTAADLLQRATREHADLFWRDAVYALRLLRRHPASTAAAILSLAIGIGLNTAVFSVVSGVLWRGLPFANSDRLVRLYEVRSQFPDQMSQVMPDDELEWQRNARSFDRLADATFSMVTFVEPGEPQSYGASAVSEGFFDVFGARPILGRLFTPAEYEQTLNSNPERRTDVPAQRQLSAMIISHSLWQGRFLGRPDIVGQRVRVSGGATLEIVGVMGPEMAALDRAVMTQAWFPGTLAAARGSVTVVGRLAAGVSVATAQAEINGISAAVKSTRKRDERDGTVFAKVQPLLDTIVNPVRSELMFLFGAVLCVLLVACANVVNLFLAHASGRRLELATRVALGATQGHLVRQTLTESLLLTALGGACGFLLAMWSVPALVAMAPPTIPRLNEIAVNWSTVVFAASVSAAVGIFCGLAASLSVNVLTPRSVLGIRTTATPQGGRFRRGLTVVEIGLALMLVIASALMVRSVRALGAVDLGFNPDHVVVAGLPSSPSNEGSATAQRIEARRIETSVIDRVKALPSVLAAGIGTGPLQGGMGIGGLQVPGDSRDFGLIRADAISPGYFEALGARLMAGRFFEPHDTADSPTVVILNAAAARLFWGDANPLGKSVVINRRDRLEVVGVIANVRAGQLDAEPGPAIYQPHVQSRNFFAGNMLIRTDGDPNALVPAIRTIFKAVNREQPFRGVEPLQDRIDRAMAPRRFILRLIGLFSILTMILAIVGVYGVLAESVAQRIPEIGIRMALGATASNVLALILRQGVWMVALGIGLGLGGAVLLRGAMTTMVFGVRTLDLSSYVAACALLMFATLAACAIPARRAARLDPVAALRLE